MNEADRAELLDRLEAARRELDEARKAMPFHSARPWQLQRLEDAEEAVAALEGELAALGE
ncbi:MAG: hypothetical protein V1797_11800 [Pseudomonadota bacterium]